ncbi:hypothetical protein [Mesobacillus zeae]|uniref:RNA polymerase subunit sigma n=1 Tax=Mesobacillus zeae TaxID=1917180 RepID=A0A398BHA1_9BACI|nr:hypothetical protein [Mesobacillus zeae]RID88018.1 hypothetical protein D1970_04075 [Mesobacillus zeae]
MSLKSIEMQVALPRTHEAGKIQEQIKQQSLIQQDNASQNVLKEDEKKRKTVFKQEQKGEAKLAGDGSCSKDERRQGQGDRRDGEEKKGPVSEHHPYKGKIIDYSG